MQYSFIETGQAFSADYVLEKPKSAKAYFTYLLSRCLRMFEYRNLPDTIPADILDRYLMTNGIACIGKDCNNELKVFFGNWGGEYDEYYRPSLFIVSNPHIQNGEKEGWFHEYVVFPTAKSTKQDGVLMRNDTGWYGLSPLISRYATLMAENCLTIRTADIMLRIVALLSAPSDEEMKSAMEYIKALENGKLKVMGESPFFDGIKLQAPPSNNGSYLTQFIELQQYLKGSFYNEIGLSANYNMKREAIGKGESTLDNDALLPLCENMLMCRREDLAKVNELFSTNIEVDFSSAWKENQVQRNIQLLSQLEESSGMGAGASSFMMGNVGGEMDNDGNGGSDDGIDKGGTNALDSNISADSSSGSGDNNVSGAREGTREDGRSDESNRGSEDSTQGTDKDSEEYQGDLVDYEDGDEDSKCGDRGGINEETVVDLTLEKIDDIVEKKIDDLASGKEEMNEQLLGSNGFESGGISDDSESSESKDSDSEE